MNRKLIAVGVIPIAALAMTAGQALAGGAISKQKAPTAAQKAAILKAGGFKGPASCYTVQLSARQQTIAGAKFNTKAKNCTKYAFDGAALFYGTSNKKVWFQLEAVLLGSDGVLLWSGQITGKVRAGGAGVTPRDREGMSRSCVDLAVHEMLQRLPRCTR